MLKSSTGTDRSDQTTMCTRMAVAEALLTENSVVNPFGLLRSTSKYGSSSVAAGTASMVQITACAGAATDSNPTNTRPIATRAMCGPPLRHPRPQDDPERHLDGRLPRTCEKAPTAYSRPRLGGKIAGRSTYAVALRRRKVRAAIPSSTPSAARAPQDSVGTVAIGTTGAALKLTISACSAVVRHCSAFAGNLPT